MICINELNIDEQPFNNVDEIRNISEKCGIYMFYDKDYNLLYVGKTSNLKNRINQHIIKNSDNTKSISSEFFYYKSFEVEDNLTAGILELYYINVLKPKYNQISVFTYNKLKKFKTKTIQLKELENVDTERDCIIKQLYNSGMKPMFIIKIKRNNINDNNVIIGNTLFIVSKNLKDIINDFILKKDIKENEYLFKSRKGKNKPLSRQQIHRIVAS